MNSFLNPVFFATLIGTVASIWAVISFARAFVQKRTSNKLISVTTFLIATASYPFAWFLGYIVGGNFGGALASMVPVQFISNPIQISLGIGIGIFVCTVAVAMAAVLCGFVMGKALEKVCALYSPK